ncbi:hypothetical protein RQP46_004625 [Phenoliferia psychrophenolica]
MLEKSDTAVREDGSAEAPFIVRWEDGDVTNPMLWPAAKRWRIVAVVAIEGLCTTFASSVYAGGLRPMGAYFEVGPTIVTLGLSLYLFGFAVAPMLWAPLSEMSGRRIVFLCSFGPFVISHLGCGAARNIETMLVMRLISGFFGSSPLTNAGGTISDMFSAGERALAISLFALAPFAGPVLGPIVAGFVGENASWRWLFWLETIFSGVVFVFGAFVPESYSPVLLRRRAKELSASTGLAYVSVFDKNLDPSETLFQKVRLNVSRPFRLLFGELIVALLSIYAAIVFAMLYLLFGAYSFVFEVNRGFSPGSEGLTFIGLWLGMVGGIIINVFVNQQYQRDLKANGGSLPPEARIPIMSLGACLLPLGLICPLFTPALFRRLGANWALTLIAFLALILTPIPFVFQKYGARIRASSHHAQAEPDEGYSPKIEEKVQARQAGLQVICWYLRPLSRGAVGDSADLFRRKNHELLEDFLEKEVAEFIRWVSLEKNQVLASPVRLRRTVEDGLADMHRSESGKLAGFREDAHDLADYTMKTAKHDFMKYLTEHHLPGTVRHHFKFQSV